MYPRTLLVLGALLLAPLLRADDVGGRQTLLGPGVNPSKLIIKSNTDRQTWRYDGDALVVTVEPGKKSTPTLFIMPADGSAWDLAAHGHVEASISVPAGDAPLSFEMRVDNDGRWQDKPWNVERTRVLPGKTMPIKVIFGYHYGYNPGYKLDPSKVSKVGIYFADSAKPVTYRIESISAGGPSGETPPVDPRTIRHTLPEGYLLGGAGATLDAKQLETHGGLKASVTTAKGQSAVDVAVSTDQDVLAIVPPQGAWDLSKSTNVEVTFTNTGSVPVTPSFFLQSGGRDEVTDTGTTGAALAPGKSATVTVPYGSEEMWEGPQGDLTQPAARRGTNGSRFKSEKVNRIAFTFARSGDAKLRIDSIRAVVVTAPLPDWVGTRPPVPGDWKMTLQDEFDGNTLNLDVWEPTGPNWWGEKAITRYSKDNVIIGGGTVRLRVEKRPGWHLDDPSTKQQGDYAAGILRTYGKWTQKYGYFEARVKLPEKTALWPAFWLMPDRGVEAGEQWKRQSTYPQGMELDVLEHLTRWGPYRYTTAMHWDGYGKNHKATGAGAYFNPTPDGWITTGVLWLPGELTYYVNGRAFAHWKNERIGDIPCEVMFTMPIGGWDNDKRPVDAELPADFIIDYVRIWQRADLR
jgi:beta-glucanase (GH16 family)